MIKLSLNAPDVSKPQAPAPFASALAAAVEAAGAQPLHTTADQAAVKKQAKQAPVQLPSNGLLTRGVRWMQQKGRSKKRMQMIETVSLGEKRFVALVKVDGREFLLGGAPSSVGMLADLGAHGLGDLLSLPIPAETASAGLPASVRPITEKVVPAAIATVQAEPVSLPEVAAVDLLSLPVPSTAPEPITNNAPVATTRVNVVVEADENESDWLLHDGLDTVSKTVTPIEPSPMHKESAKVVEIRPEPLVSAAPAIVEQPSPTTTVAPKTVNSLPSTSFANANFTFQMWPATQAVAATTTPKAVASPVAMPKVKTGIDLESCPELLGEPYLLALVQKSHGAAA